MKVRIDVDSYYPFYLIGGSVGKEVELPPKRVEWIQSVMDQLRKVQDYLEKQVKDAVP